MKKITLLFILLVCVSVSALSADRSKKTNENIFPNFLNAIEGESIAADDFSFLSSLYKSIIVQQDSNKIKIAAIQLELVKIVSEGNKWIKRNIGKKAFENDGIIKYKVLASPNMYAQLYQGYSYKKGKGTALYYSSIYSSKKSISIAKQAIDELVALKNSEWMILNTSTYIKESQILYFKGIEVGSTSYFKTSNPQFEISLI